MPCWQRGFSVTLLHPKSTLQWWARQDLNLGPTGYEPGALPLSYGPFVPTKTKPIRHCIGKKADVYFDTIVNHIRYYLSTQQQIQVVMNKKHRYYTISRKERWQTCLEEATIGTEELQRIPGTALFAKNIILLKTGPFIHIIPIKVGRLPLAVSSMLWSN